MKYTTKSLGKIFTEQARKFGDKDFIIYPDRNLRWSWTEFNTRVDSLAKGLISIGITKGDHVGIWAKNVPDWLTFMFATAKIGAVLVTVNTNYKSHEVAYIMKQADLKTIAIIDSFKDIDYIDIIYGLLPELKTAPRGSIHNKEFPELHSVIYIGQEKHRGMYNTSELIMLGRHTEDSKLSELLDSTDIDDVVNMQYTSGTTGFPKGVMLTSRNIVNNGYYIGESQKFTDKEILCLPVPLFHCFGIVLGVMAIFTHGGTLVMIEVFDPLLTLAAVEKEHCTALYGVPTMFIAEMDHPMFSMFDMSSLRTGIMAGSPCPMERMKQCMDKMNMTDVTIAYGLTESSPVMTQTTTEDSIQLKVETVGRHLPEIEVCIKNPDTGELCPPNVIGELCTRGYNIMKGYYKMPEATAKVIDSDGWLHSGDLGTCDDNGYYRITGRLKDMIIRGGENVYPREIEEFISLLEGVQDVQVVGIPDEKYGEIVGAFVICAAGYELQDYDIKDYCKNKIARYKIPRHVFIVDSFPLTASGKIQKFKLREQAVELLNITCNSFNTESK